MNETHTECPHCQVSVRRNHGAGRRWHFDNCKKNPARAVTTSAAREDGGIGMGGVVGRDDPGVAAMNPKGGDGLRVRRVPQRDPRGAHPDE
jgi:hypothetical protein